MDSIRTKRMGINRGLGVVLALLLVVQPLIPAWGQSRGLIRDAEIEATIRAYCAPLWHAAGLDPSFVEVHLIADQQLNSFVSGGQHIFINTGLITRAATPNEVIGVLAHETGHIIGGHLVRFREALENASIEAIIGALLSAGAAVGGAFSGDAGAASAGVGTASLGESIALRNLLQYSRGQEASADQAGLKLLDATHQSSRGLLQFFQILSGQEHFLAINQNPYLRTHPLTQERVSAVADHVAHSPYSDNPDPPALVAMHRRMVAKLEGYLEPLDRVLRDYPPKDSSEPARYARAVGYFRASRLQQSLAEMDSLLKDAPQDPYFLEQKAQILYQNGRIADAVKLYQAAVDLRPNETLLRTELAEAQIESENDAYIPAAVKHLEYAARLESDNPTTWHFLAIAYGRGGNLGMASLAQSEEAIARGNRRDARFHAQRALKELKSNSPGALRAQDILSSTVNPEGGQ
ncbi:MAG TPA: M48 family metalloprotease [Dongiaceae bacterium]|nr:M48 family metalloprotease [Dongiaceae bacterium]